MEKLKLNPEALRVQSFSASAEKQDADQGAEYAAFTRPYLCDPLTVRNC
jgi:hypothetical protein